MSYKTDVKQFFIKNVVRNEIKIMEIDRLLKKESSKALFDKRNHHVRQVAFFNKLIDIETVKSL